MDGNLTTTADDARPETAGGRTVPEQSSEGSANNQLPTPPTSINAECDYSDVASVDSQNSTSPRRRYKRGGRRKKRGGKLQSVSELEIPKDGQSEEQEGTTDIEWKEETPSPEDYDAEELRKAKSSRPSSSSKKQSSSATTRPDTGIKAFNVARAESSGGRRPVGITIERPKSTGKQKGKNKDKGKKKKKTDKRPEGASEGEGDENDGESETETETRKPVSIRFDLNLEVEIFLRAKIKGEVTVTFL